MKAAPLFGLGFGRTCNHAFYFYNKTQTDKAVMRCSKCKKRVKRGDLVLVNGIEVKVRYTPKGDSQ